MSMNTNLPTRPDDEIDRLFSAYFRTQRPTPWPACPRPWEQSIQPAAAVSRDAAARSRWALAASVALLVGSCWYLSGHVTDGKAKPGFNPDGGGANLQHIKDLGKDKPAPKMP